MSSFRRRSRAPSGPPMVGGSTEIRIPERQPTSPQKRDPNAPDRRLQMYQKCLYERRLPGNAFISAHVNRVQRGYYETQEVHEPALNNVYFVSVHFVFHPSDNRTHRFKSASIRISVHGDSDPGVTNGSVSEKDWYDAPQMSPRIIRHAPELMYGSISPENLQWNFSLSSSFGIAQAPVAATVSPAGGLMGSYKIYDMMSIQGSLRTLESPHGSAYDVEDGMAVWTLQENLLQKSGLPRDFDFVLLVHKPDELPNVFMQVDVDAVVDAWFGNYPQWYMNAPAHRPSLQYRLELNADIGQRFSPIHSSRGFNFAELPHPLEEYVAMPGTTYPTNEAQASGDAKPRRQSAVWEDPRPPRTTGPFADTNLFNSPMDRYASGGTHDAARFSWTGETLNVRVILDHPNSALPSVGHLTGPRTSGPEPNTYRSIRRCKPRSGLNDHSARQPVFETTRGACTLARSPSKTSLSASVGFI